LLLVLMTGVIPSGDRWIRDPESARKQALAGQVVAQAIDQARRGGDSEAIRLARGDREAVLRVGGRTKRRRALLRDSSRA
jgi:type II secretory pathway pseudopilin PulG